MYLVYCSVDNEIIVLLKFNAKLFYFFIDILLNKDSVVMVVRDFKIVVNVLCIS